MVKTVQSCLISPRTKKKKRKKRKSKEVLPKGVTIRDIGDGYPPGFPDERKAPKDRKGYVEKVIPEEDEEMAERIRERRDKGKGKEDLEEGVRRKLDELRKDDWGWGLWMDMNMDMKDTPEWRNGKLSDRMAFFEEARKKMFGLDEDNDVFLRVCSVVSYLGGLVLDNGGRVISRFGNPAPHNSFYMW